MPHLLLLLLLLPGSSAHSMFPGAETESRWTAEEPMDPISTELATSPGQFGSRLVSLSPAPSATATPQRAAHGTHAARTAERGHAASLRDRAAGGGHGTGDEEGGGSRSPTGATRDADPLSARRLVKAMRAEALVGGGGGGGGRCSPETPRRPGAAGESGRNRAPNVFFLSLGGVPRGGAVRAGGLGSLVVVRGSLRSFRKWVPLSASGLPPNSSIYCFMIFDG